ncbi:MAG: MFS transporter [Acidobacteria bacterium]|nr:MFS transporter [Acidobacteriota bacterium]
MSTQASAFTALKHRNFRLLWIGQVISLSGSMMQTAAILWHVSLLAPAGHKGLALGMVGLVRFLPIVLFSMVSGVVADVYDRRRVMLITQSVMAVLAFVLGLLAWTGLQSLWPIYLLAGLTAIAGSFDSPSRQALVPNLVPRGDLPNAISLNTIMFQIAAVAGGPAFAGAMLLGDIAWAYWLNAISFLFVMAALLMMREVQGRGTRDRLERPELTVRAAMDGLRFVFAQPLIRSSMLLDFFATFFASANSLLPIFAQDILVVGAHGYGWLYAAQSVGALVASAAMVPLVDRIDRRGSVMLWSVAAFGMATVAFGLTRSFWVMFACLALSGVADTVSMVFRNVIRQMETPDYMRGRMVGVNMVFFMGGPQLGEVEAGVVANLFSAPFSVVTGGIGCVVATAWIAARTPSLRRYRRGPARTA